MKKVIAIPAVIALLLLTSPVQADTGVSWNDLNSYEQKLLIALEDEWASMPAERQLELQQGAQRWLNSLIEDRRLDRKRYERWKHLSRSEKEGLRKRFQKFQDLSPEERQQVREARRRFEQMPPEERERLRERWEALPEDVRARIEARRAHQRMHGKPHEHHSHRQADGHAKHHSPQASSSE